MLARLFLVSLIAFYLEIGVFLLVLPWTSIWEFNYFRFRYPELTAWMLNFYLRGAVSGLGLVDLGLAAWSAAHFRELLAHWSAALAAEDAKESEAGEPSA